MALQERNYMKGTDPDPSLPPGGATKLIDRLNELGERHATAIISISTGLIILTVLIFAKYFYDKSQLERAEVELSKADTVEQLQDLKTKFGATPVGPRIAYRLANRLYEDGKLDQARAEYKDFLTRYPTDRLAAFVTRAQMSLERNAKFETEGKEARLKEYRLQSHPRQFADAKDPRFEWGPQPPANPVVQIDLAGGTVKADLFEQDAPNAVAAFIKLAGEKYFDGLKWEVIGSNERLQPQAKAEKPVELTLAREISKRSPEAYSLVLAKKNGGVNGTQFQILLRPVPDLKDATVFGVVTEGADALKAVKKDDVIKSISVVSKADHPYEPQPLKN
jgi:peptidyl-prolyl cis-trans isomerase B (cyclophilin B)